MINGTHRNYDATWSITAYDPVTRDIGVIVTTKRPAVGNRCPWAVPGVGAVSSQASSNPLLASRIISLLARGWNAQTALEMAVSEDLGNQDRQVCVVDSAGRSAAFTGKNPGDWKGHHTGKYFATAGNILAGSSVIEQTASVFESSHGPLAYRLLDAMDAGQAQGGDARGKQSAAIIVARPGWMPYIDVRVDDHKEPLVELRRLLGLWMQVVDATKSPSPQLGYRTLLLGSEGPDVRDLQVMLRDIGLFSGDIDGVFGAILEVAAKRFQANTGVRTDGIIGPDTAARISTAYWERHTLA